MNGYAVMLMKDSEGKAPTPSFCRDGRPTATCESGIYPTYTDANKFREYMKSLYPNNWYAIAHVNNQKLEE